jgi:outer membrane protein assembly factor BamB
MGVRVSADSYVLDINVTTDKQFYNVGEVVKITGNVTVNGTLQTDRLVAVSVDFPNGNPFLIRTVDTGTPSGFWKVQIVNFTACNSMGIPQTLFYPGPGNWLYFNTFIKNFDAAPHNVTMGLYIQFSDNTPLVGYYPMIETEIESGQTIQKLASVIEIPTGAPAGEAKMFVSLFSQKPVGQGIPYAPETRASFFISSMTPLMPPVPEDFNATFRFPVLDVYRGNYVIWATSGFLTQTAMERKEFTVIGPVPVMSYSPPTPIASQTITFDGSASYDVGGTVMQWHWDFMDGEMADGPVVTHAYQQGGYYLPTLTVTDNDGGFNSTMKPITIIEAWPMFHHDASNSGSSTTLAPATNLTKWSKTIGPASGDSWMYSSPAATPAIAGNAVYVGSTNGTAYAFNAGSGALIWAVTPAPGYKFYSSPAYSDGLVFIGSENGRVYALNATNGNTKYSILTGNAVYASPTTLGQKVYVGSNDTRVYAFFTNGTLNWTSPALDGAVTFGVALGGGKVFAGTTNNTLYALNEKTGTVNWTMNPSLGMQFYGSPAYSNGRVYAGSTDNRIYALNAANGTLLWNYTTGGQIHSSPAVADNFLFIGSGDGKLYALDAITGSLVWDKTLGAIKWSSPTVAEGKVLVGTVSGRMYALRVGNGELWWSYQTGGEIGSSSGILNDTLFVTSKEGRLYAIYGQAHDVATTVIAATSVVIRKNTVATFYAGVWNRGSYSESVNIAAKYNGTTFYSTNVPTLARSVEVFVALPWDTTAVTAGTYVISVTASIVPPPVDQDTSNNINSTQVRVEYADIDIASVTPSTPEVNMNITIPAKTVLGKDYGALIYVKTGNESKFTEYYVQVTVYWSNGTYANQTIGSTLIPVITPGAFSIVYVQWNTTDVAYGNYTVSAYISPVSSEVDIADNYRVFGTVRVGIPGDVSGITVGQPDSKVDMRDISAICAKFLTRPSSPTWDPNKDTNNDGKVDMRDIALAASNFGKTE